MRFVSLSDLAATAKKIGGTEAIVEHATANAGSWHGYWQNLVVTFFAGTSSLSVKVGYASDGWFNGFGCVPDPTGRALASERQAVEILRQLGYEVVAELSR
jgi:hypothetical protein